MPWMIHSHGVYIRQSVNARGGEVSLGITKILNLSSASSSPNTFHFHWYVVHNIMLQCCLTLLSSALICSVQLGYFLRNKFSQWHNDGRTSNSNHIQTACYRLVWWMASCPFIISTLIRRHRKQHTIRLEHTIQPNQYTHHTPSILPRPPQPYELTRRAHYIS